MAGSDEVGSDARREHPLPAPQRLLPERRVEERHLRVAVPLVAAPNVVHEQVEAAMLLLHSCEEARHLLVDRVVAAHRHTNAASGVDELGRVVDRAAPAPDRRPRADAAAADIDGRSRLTEYERDPAPRAPARPRDDAHHSTKIKARIHRLCLDPPPGNPPPGSGHTRRACGSCDRHRRPPVWRKPRESRAATAGTRRNAEEKTATTQTSGSAKIAAARTQPESIRTADVSARR